MDVSNTMKFQWNGHHIAEAIIELNFWTENGCMSIQLSAKFIPNGQVVNKSPLFRVMTWPYI